jgi:hypothetical protein
VLKPPVIEDLERIVRQKDQQTSQLLNQLASNDQSASGPDGGEMRASESSMNHLGHPNPFASLDLNGSTSESFTPPLGAGIPLPSYPSRLPPPDILFSLIDIFFDCYLDAHRVIHRPTLQASLYLPPQSEGYPHAALLHAICAVAFTFALSSNASNHLGYKGSIAGCKCCSVNQPSYIYGDQCATSLGICKPNRPMICSRKVWNRNMVYSKHFKVGTCLDNLFLVDKICLSFGSSLRVSFQASQVW